MTLPDLFLTTLCCAQDLYIGNGGDFLEHKDTRRIMLPHTFMRDVDL